MRILFVLFLTPLLFAMSLKEPQKPIFQKSNAKLPLLTDIKPEIYGYHKPIETKTLIDTDKIPLFLEPITVYPKLYGFQDSFFIQGDHSVVVLDFQKIRTSLISPFGMTLTHITSDNREAFILQNDRLYSYDGKTFTLLPYSFRYAHKLFIDAKNLYLDASTKLIDLSRTFPRYTLYKKLQDIDFCYGTEKTFYFKKHDTLYSATLDNDIEPLLPLRYCVRFHNYYLTRNGSFYSLYAFPKRKIATFAFPKSISGFFILKNRLYLINNDHVVAKLDIATKRLQKITPVFFYPLSYDCNDNFVAFYHENRIYILDSNLTTRKTYSVRFLPDIFSIAISGKNIAYISHKHVYLNGYPLFTPAFIETEMAFDKNALAIASYSSRKHLLQIDIFKNSRHLRSFTLPVRAKMLRKIVLHNDTVIALFFQKALIIHNGKIVRQIPFHLNSPTSLQKRGSLCYLGYDDKLVKIDLDTLELEVVESGEYGIQKGEGLRVYIEKFLPLFLNIDFSDVQYTIATPDDIYSYYALRSYALIWFKLHPHTILVVKKGEIFWLKLTSKHNKILALYPLENNRFAIVDGFGVRVIDLDTLKSRRFTLAPS